MLRYDRVCPLHPLFFMEIFQVKPPVQSFIHSVQFLSDGDFQVKAPGNLEEDVDLHVGCRPIRCLGFLTPCRICAFLYMYIFGRLGVYLSILPSLVLLLIEPNCTILRTHF